MNVLNLRFEFIYFLQTAYQALAEKGHVTDRTTAK